MVIPIEDLTDFTQVIKDKDEGEENEKDEEEKNILSRDKSFLLIKAREVEIVKEVKRSDSL